MNESIVMVMSHICDDIIDNDHFFSSQLFDSLKNKQGNWKASFFCPSLHSRVRILYRFFCTYLYKLVRTCSSSSELLVTSLYKLVRPRTNLYVLFVQICTYLFILINLYILVKTSILNRVSKFRANKHSNTKKYETKA